MVGAGTILPLPPGASISASSTSIAYNESVTINWNTSGATSLSSNFERSELNGSITISNLISSRSFTITASNQGGSTTRSVTVNVAAPAKPTVNLSVSPSSIANGGSATLNWNSSNATSVSSSNFGASTTSGSVTLTNLTSSQTYSITVNGPGGSETATATLTPFLTPTLTASPTVTPGLTTTPTPTITSTQTPTPTTTPTLTSTPTLTPTVSARPNVTITVNLTVDAGNSGYTQIYYPLTDGGALGLRQTLYTTSATTFTIPTGNYFYVAVTQQTRVFDYQVSEIIYRVNGTPDAGSPYIQSALNSPIILQNVPLYGGSGYPTATYGNTYVVDTYIGNQR